MLAETVLADSRERAARVCWYKCTGCTTKKILPWRSTSPIVPTSYQSSSLNYFPRYSLSCSRSRASFTNMSAFIFVHSSNSVWQHVGLRLGGAAVGLCAVVSRVCPFFARGPAVAGGSPVPCEGLRALEWLRDPRNSLCCTSEQKTVGGGGGGAPRAPPPSPRAYYHYY